jgi:hypothetical protein
MNWRFEYLENRFRLSFEERLAYPSMLISFLFG